MAVNQPCRVVGHDLEQSVHVSFDNTMHQHQQRKGLVSCHLMSSHVHERRDSGGLPSFLSPCGFACILFVALKREPILYEAGETCRGEFRNRVPPLLGRKGVCVCVCILSVNLVFRSGCSKRLCHETRDQRSQAKTSVCMCPISVCVCVSTGQLSLRVPLAVPNNRFDFCDECEQTSMCRGIDSREEQQGRARRARYARGIRP